MNKYKTGPWLVLAAALLWAVDTPFRKFLTEGLTSTTIVFMEHIVIAFLVLPLLLPRLHELKKLGWKEWAAVAFIALGGSVLATIFFTESFRYTNPSVSILLQKIQPFIAIALAWLLLKEKLGKKFWLWAALGIFGAYLVSFPEFKVSGLSFAGGSRGVTYALLAAFLWGGSTVFGRLVLDKISFQLMTALRFLGALLFLFIAQIWIGTLPEISSATGKDWIYILIIAVLAGYISLLIYYKGLKSTKASVATISELAFPFAAVVVNWVFLDATLSLVQIAGGIILLLAVAKLSLVNREDIVTQSTKVYNEAS